MYKRRFAGRRTERQIEADVMAAVANIVAERGISFVSIKEAAKLSRTEPIVLERRYKNDEGLIRAYTAQFDYFLNDHIALDPMGYDSADAFFESLIDVFVQTLHKAKDMQSIMVWEMYEDSALTRKSARKREETLKDFLPAFAELIDRDKIEPEALFAVLTGGLYYVMLRGSRSTFCGIDFNTKQGRQILSDTLHKIVEQFLKPDCQEPQG